jgi:hypothetical protein
VVCNSKKEVEDPNEKIATMGVSGFDPNEQPSIRKKILRNRPCEMIATQLWASRELGNGCMNVRMSTRERAYD